MKKPAIGSLVKYQGKTHIVTSNLKAKAKKVHVMKVDAGYSATAEEIAAWIKADGADGFAFIPGQAVLIAELSPAGRLPLMWVEYP